MAVYGQVLKTAFRQFSELFSALFLAPFLAPFLAMPGGECSYFGRGVGCGKVLSNL